MNIIIDKTLVFVEVLLKDLKGTDQIKYIVESHQKEYANLLKILKIIVYKFVLILHWYTNINTNNLVELNDKLDSIIDECHINQHTIYKGSLNGIKRQQ
jgi:hypothetical protein